MEVALSSQIRAEAKGVVERLRAAGHEAYYAGGCVRDTLMGHEPKDYDVATSARPCEVIALFPRTHAVGAQFGVVLVHTDAGDIEVATFRAEMGYADGRHPDAVTFCSAREDVQRRDFTINGMLFDPMEEKVLDWVGGRDDIARRMVRTIGDPQKRFSEDRLRLLRAIRFAARFDFSIENETYAALCELAELIVEVSAERLREELVRILRGGRAGHALRLMHDTGLLKAVLPEVEAMIGVDQPPLFHPEGDVFEHTCMMLDAMDAPSVELAMAVLLHDVGKPQTQTFAERIRFDEHDRVGAAIAADICRRLRFSNDEMREIVSLIESHMRFRAVKDMKLSTLKRLLGLPRFDEHLELHRLDCAASHGKLDNYEFLRQKLSEFSQEEIAPAPLLTGHDLIEMGYAPGPLFGEIIDALREEQLNGRLTSRDAALAWLATRYPKA